jgi:putative endopeptidase
MSPQTVNAYYNPYYNELFFQPWQILQPPFYNYNADAPKPTSAVWAQL